MRRRCARLRSRMAACVAALVSAGIAAAQPLPAPPPASALPVPAWTVALEQRLRAADARHPGDIGVYVLHLERGESYSYQAEEPWYLASGVKVPVAIAVLREIDRGGLTLDTRLSLLEDDFVDGAGGTNAFGPGSRLRVSYLLEQMIIHSDNTATDVLIRTVGLEQVNEVAAHLIDARVQITTLADVRRLAYGQFHPGASALRSRDLLALQRSPAGPARVSRLAELLAVTPDAFAQTDLGDAFEAYYATHVNSATLVDYGRMLATLVEGKALRPQTTAWLLDTMERVQTGRRRIRAGLPAGTRFAHKTGTQYHRTCDLGIVQLPATPGQRVQPAHVVIAACARGSGTAAGERALRAVGAAVTASGVFVDAPPVPTVSDPRAPP